MARLIKVSGNIWVNPDKVACVCRTKSGCMIDLSGGPEEDAILIDRPIEDVVRDLNNAGDERQYATLRKVCRPDRAIQEQPAGEAESSDG